MPFPLWQPNFFLICINLQAHNLVALELLCIQIDCFHCLEFISLKSKSDELGPDWCISQQVVKCTTWEQEKVHPFWRWLRHLKRHLERYWNFLVLLAYLLKVSVLLFTIEKLWSCHGVVACVVALRNLLNNMLLVKWEVIWCFVLCPWHNHSHLVCGGAHV